MFLESLINGLATALGYFIVFVLMGLLTWRFGSRIASAMIGSMMQNLMSVMTGVGQPPSMGTRGDSPMANMDMTQCAICSFPLVTSFKYCPDCGVEVKKETAS